MPCIKEEEVLQEVGVNLGSVQQRPYIRPRGKKLDRRRMSASVVDMEKEAGSSPDR